MLAYAGVAWCSALCVVVWCCGRVRVGEAGSRWHARGAPSSNGLQSDTDTGRRLLACHVHTAVTPFSFFARLPPIIFRSPPTRRPTNMHTYALFDQTSPHDTLAAHLVRTEPHRDVPPCPMHIISSSYAQTYRTITTTLIPTPNINDDVDHQLRQLTAGRSQLGRTLSAV